MHTCGVHPSAENVIWPLRDDVDLFSEAMNVTTSLPLPKVVFNHSHDASVETDHYAFDVTEMLFQPSAASMLIVVGEIDSEGEAPDCFTVQTCQSQPLA